MFAFLHHHWSISISTIRNNPAKITFSHKSFFHVCNEIFKDSLKAKLCKFTKANRRGTREIKISWGDLVGLISKHRFSSSAPSRNLSRVERIESRIQRDGIEKRERERWNGKQKRLKGIPFCICSWKRNSKVSSFWPPWKQPLKLTRGSNKRSTEDQRDPTFQTDLNTPATWRINIYNVACVCDFDTSIQFLFLE